MLNIIARAPILPILALGVLIGCTAPETTRAPIPPSQAPTLTAAPLRPTSTANTTPTAATMIPTPATTVASATAPAHATSTPTPCNVSAGRAEPAAPIVVYFTCAYDPPPAAPRPLARPIPEQPATQANLRAALESLLMGPTPAEQAAGWLSWFSPRTAGMLNDVTMTNDGVVTVDFADFSSIIPNASTSAGAAMLLAQLNSTVFQFDDVQTIIYQFDGSCDAFFLWLQMACQPTTRAAWQGWQQPATPATAHGQESGGLPGPEWRIAARGDANGDGSDEIIAYRPSDVVPSGAFAKPYYADYTLVASEIVIAQARPDGTSLVLVAMSSDGVTASDKNLIRFVADDMPARRPAAFLLAVTMSGNIPVAVIPLEANGEAYSQGVGVYWNAEQRAYRLFAMGRYLP